MNYQMMKKRPIRNNGGIVDQIFRKGNEFYDMVEVFSEEQAVLPEITVVVLEAEPREEIATSQTQEEISASPTGLQGTDDTPNGGQTVASEPSVVVPGKRSASKMQTKKDS